MGIRTFCAALALVVGIGQADAATYNIAVTMTENDQYCWRDFTCGPKPDNRSWRGLLLDTAVHGALSITGASDTGAHVSLYLNNGERVFDEFMNRNPLETGYWIMTSGWGVDLFWDGETGSFYYADDGYPWDRGVRATMTLGEAPAPVPLPATAALLPLGIGALAIMRRRRPS